MQLVQHYNDLTEIKQLRYVDRGVPSAEKVKELEKQVKTRICFTDVKAYSPGSIRIMDEAGWKIGRKTLDWHEAHQGDSELRLYYKIFPDINSDPNDKRKRQRPTYSCHHSLSGSCSMGLIDTLDDWLKSPGFPYRYLTLVRLDRKRTKEEILKMRYFRYRLVFRTDVARYFANGWLPDDWPGSVEKEKTWWNSKEAPTLKGWEELKAAKFPQAK